MQSHPERYLVPKDIQTYFCESILLVENSSNKLKMSVDFGMFAYLVFIIFGCHPPLPLTSIFCCKWAKKPTTTCLLIFSILGGGWVAQTQIWKIQYVFYPSLSFDIWGWQKSAGVICAMTSDKKSPKWKK